MGIDTLFYNKTKNQHASGKDRLHSFPTLHDAWALAWLMNGPWNGDAVEVKGSDWISQESWGMYGLPEWPEEVKVPSPPSWWFEDEAPGPSKQVKA